jgi:hypothetical protein
MAKTTTTQPAIKNSTVYMAIRLSSDGYEWADVHTASGSLVCCRERAEGVDQSIPHWAAANPVQRIARFDLQESR